MIFFLKKASSERGKLILAWKTPLGQCVSKLTNLLMEKFYLWVGEINVNLLICHLDIWIITGWLWIRCRTGARRLREVSGGRAASLEGPSEAEGGPRAPPTDDASIRNFVFVCSSRIGIPHICHFSPQARFLVQFFST